MHLKIQQRNGRAYLTVVQNYRQAGKTKSRTVETIGYADRYAGEFPDPIEHFRAYVDDLNMRAARRARPIRLAFGADDTIEADAAAPARLGAAIALGCLDAIGAGGYFRARTGRDGFTPHAGRVFEMLAAERMMHAASKREAWTARASFPRACSFSFEDVYASLPCIARESEKLDACARRRWSAFGDEPDTGRIFLVCGSYAFPVDGGSMRASIAVALGRDNMPLGHHDLEGRLNPAAFREAADALKERLCAGRAIVVAGGLRDLEPTIAELAAGGDGFVLYQRDFNELRGVTAWAEDDVGYAPMGGGVLAKWREASRTLPGGQALPVKEVVLRGGGYAVRHRHAVLVTSELDLSAQAVVQLYRELWRQAEPFQPLEADFSSVPFPTPARDHIRAHFAICYAAFAALRVLRWKMGWSHNAADTADALLRMEGGHLQQNYYLFSYRSPVTDAIENAVGIPAARKLRTQADLRSVAKTVRDAISSTR